MRGDRPSPPARVLVVAIEGYRRAVSPFLGARCRFYPSCSSYAVQALRRYGAMRGSWLAVRRIGRCHPWHPGGVDPVPDRLAVFGVERHRDRDIRSADMVATTTGAGRCTH